MSNLNLVSEEPQSSPQPSSEIVPTTPAETTPLPGESPSEKKDGALSGLRRAIGIRNADEKAMEERYEQWVQYATRPDADLSQVPGYLAAAAEAAKLKPKRADEIKVNTLRAFMKGLLEDNVITEEEDEWSNRVVAALGVDSAWLTAHMTPETIEIMTARANTGRLEARDEHELITKGGEEVYLEVIASKTKEVVIKEYQAGYAGVSYKISKNMRVNTGGARGRMVPVGTEIQVEDVGILSITNQRVVFMGSKKTQEFLYTKLVGINMFEEGLTLGVSNRQTSSSFQVDYPQLVAATIGAAASRSES